MKHNICVVTIWEKPHERLRSRTQCTVKIYPRVIDYCPADFSIELPNSYISF
jgi:hypothetical protein